jgi:hypothetical protein
MKRGVGWALVGVGICGCSDRAPDSVGQIEAAATSAPVTMIFESWDGMRTYQEHMNPTAGSGTYNLSFETYALLNPVNVFPNGNKSLHRQPVVGDFTLTVKARAQAAAGWNDFSILYNYRDAQNYDFASFNEGNDNETNGLFRVRQGVLTELADFAELTLPADLGNSRNPSASLHQIAIEWRGGQLSASRNGTVLARIPVADSPSGYIGLGSNNDVAYFDDLKVVAYAPQPAPPEAALAFGFPQPDANPPTVVAGLIGLYASQDNTSGAQFRVDGAAAGGAVLNPLFVSNFDGLKLSNGAHGATVTATTVDGRTLTASTSFQVQNDCTRVPPGGVLQLPVGPFSNNAHITWDAVPEGSPMDGGFALSRGPTRYFSGTSVAVMFGQDGSVVARNGSSYRADNVYRYRPGEVHRFNVDVAFVKPGPDEAPVPSKTYSVALAATDLRFDLAIGQNYAFRTDRAYDALDYWDVIVDPASSFGLKVCNVKFSGF